MNFPLAACAGAATASRRPQLRAAPRMRTAHQHYPVKFSHDNSVEKLSLPPVIHTRSEVKPA